LSRATVWLDRGITRSVPRGFSEFEAWRDQVLEEEEREHHKLGRKIVAEEHWMRYGVTARASATCAASASWQPCARTSASTAARSARDDDHTEAEMSGKLVAEADNIAKTFASNRSCATSRSASSAATASALSGRMAPARPRYSNC